MLVASLVASLRPSALTAPLSLSVQRQSAPLRSAQSVLRRLTAQRLSAILPSVQSALRLPIALRRLSAPQRASAQRLRRLRRLRAALVALRPNSGETL